MKLTDVLLNRKRAEVTREETVDRWAEEVQAIPIHLVSAGIYQPRQDFEEESLAELAESIEVHGLLQPILVRRASIGYEVIVGERRLRACKSLGWEVIPAIVKEANDKEVAEMALIENLQRADLHVFEVADGYGRLLQEFEMTQEELAQRLGISQANVANKLRLLKLPHAVREIISREMLSERHSRALLRLEGEEQQLRVLEQVVKNNLNVKQTEELVNTYLATTDKTQAPASERQARRKLIIKDLRLFTNSLRDLTTTLKSSGLEVSLKEREDDEVYEVKVIVKKPQGGEGNGKGNSDH